MAPCELYSLEVGVTFLQRLKSVVKIEGFDKFLRCEGETSFLIKLRISFRGHIVCGEL